MPSGKGPGHGKHEPSAIVNILFPLRSQELINTNLWSRQKAGSTFVYERDGAASPLNYHI
jgi:hypothetical protein